MNAAGTASFLTDASGTVLTATADLRTTHTVYDSLGRVVQSISLGGVTIGLSADAGTAGTYSSSFSTGYPQSDVLSSTSTAFNPTSAVMRCDRP